MYAAAVADLRQCKIYPMAAVAVAVDAVVTLVAVTAACCKWGSADD